MREGARPRPVEREYARIVERHRDELHAHSRRILRSSQDAEDALQEALLRAWRALPSFEGRSSLRSWLHRIVINTSLDAVQGRPSRIAPVDVDRATPAESSPAPALDPPLESRYLTREEFERALVVAMRVLSARQRAVLILREALGFSARDTASRLGISVAAANSHLQRARARLEELEPEPEELLEPTDQRARALLDGYIAAFERSDAGLLEQVLRTDAMLEATPFRDWQAGRAKCIHMLDVYVLGAPGDWQMTATTANGQPAAAVYHLGRPHGVVVLAASATGISRVVDFHDPALVALFGFPEVRTG